MQTFKINRRYQLHKVASRDPRRFGFAGVRIDHEAGIPDRPVAVATNGRTIAVVPLEHAGDPGDVEAATIGASVWKALTSNQRAHERTALQVDAERARAVNGSSTHEAPHEEGEFPRWRDVMDSKPVPGTADVVVRINVKLLRELTEGLGSDAAMLTIPVRDGGKVLDAIKVRPIASETCESPDERARGLIMPIVS